jgi:uracil DNA glycosylase
MCIALGDLCGFEQRCGFLPRLGRVLDMFRMIMPYDVRVVIIAQSPYPGCCPSTGIPYACGPAFLPSKGCATTPMTLRNIILEICRDLSTNRTKQPQEMLLDWINQGVMLLNSSLTLGTNCPKYLEDHTIMWQEIMQDLVYTICKKVDPVFVLVGKDAWKLESSVSQSTRVIKVSHPVARKETSTPWYGSGVFSRVSKMMVERGEMPIRWI